MSHQFLCVLHRPPPPWHSWHRRRWQGGQSWLKESQQLPGQFHSGSSMFVWLNMLTMSWWCVFKHHSLNQLKRNSIDENQHQGTADTIRAHKSTRPFSQECTGGLWAQTSFFCSARHNTHFSTKHLNNTFVGTKLPMNKSRQHCTAILGCSNKDSPSGF